MRIYCQHCGQVLEVYDEIADGQHILCPYCNKKFSYFNMESASNNGSSCGGKGKKLWLPICLIVIVAVLVAVKLHFFPSDETKLEEMTTWYERTLNYNGLSEMEYFHNEEGQTFILTFVGAGKEIEHIEWYTKMGMIWHPRSMVKGFAEDLIKARVAIEILRNKLHPAERPPVGVSNCDTTSIGDIPLDMKPDEVKNVLRKKGLSDGDIKGVLKKIEEAKRNL